MLEPIMITVESAPAKEWTDAVGGSPIAVAEAVAAVVIEVVAGRAAVVSVISTFHGDATGQDDQEHTDHQQPRKQACERGHRGDTFLVWLAGHSSTPNGAPSGSAISASLPPWRSSCGATNTRPPSATARAVVFSASSTRT